MRRLALIVVALLLLTACNGDPPTISPSETESSPPAGQSSQGAQRSEGAQGSEEAQRACGPVEKIPIQGQGHLVGDQKPPVPYNSTPPTSGWHASGEVPIAVAKKPLTEPEQVTVLEQAGVVVSYSEIAKDDLKALTALVKGELSGYAALTRYDKLEAGEIALTGWGRLQKCTRPDKRAITAFVVETTGPEQSD